MTSAVWLAVAGMLGVLAGALAVSSSPASPGGSRAPQAPAAASEGVVRSQTPIWTRWNGWNERCPFDVAPARESLPSLSWEPCTALGIHGAGCRRLVPASSDAGAAPIAFLGVVALARHTQRGRTLLAFTRFVRGASGAQPRKQWIVADADGPILAAIAEPAVELGWKEDNRAPGCTLVESGLTDEGAAWVVRGDGASATTQSKVDGLLTFTFGEREPRVLFRNQDDAVSSWAVGGAWLVRSVAPARRAELYSAAGDLVTTLHEPSQDADALPLAGNSPLVDAGGVVFEVGDTRTRALLAYHAGSVRPLLRWPVAEGRGAGNAGSDGYDLVWTEGEGALGDGRYARTWVVSSPHSTDASALRPRRVSTDPNPLIGAAPFVVGCGRAAHWAPGGPFVVRLQDGAIAVLPRSEGLRWGRPLALTCRELFWTYYRGSEAGIARIALTSFG